MMDRVERAGPRQQPIPGLLRGCQLPRERHAWARAVRIAVTLNGSRSHARRPCGANLSLENLQTRGIGTAVTALQVANSARSAAVRTSSASGVAHRYPERKQHTSNRRRSAPQGDSATPADRLDEPTSASPRMCETQSAVSASDFPISTGRKRAPSGVITSRMASSTGAFSNEQGVE